MTMAERSHLIEINLLKEANLIPPKHCSSIVWKFFGFKQEGVIKDPCHVQSTLIFVLKSFSYLYVGLILNVGYLCCSRL